MKRLQILLKKSFIKEGIQRNQNKVIWLQNAQKTLENTMSKV